MKAVTIVEGNIEVTEKPDPVPGRDQVLVKVRAAGINGADLLQKRGHYPPPPGIPEDIPGLELAGEVIALGPGASRFAIGDRVMAVVGGAAQAELAAVDEREAMPAPSVLDWVEAGGLPEAFTTAHDALFTSAGLKVGHRLCVHGAAGGVGTAAVQLGSAAGATVTATVRSLEIADKLEALGAAKVTTAEDFASRGPFDVILELVGAQNLAANLGALEIGGAIVVIGVGAGSRCEIDLRSLMSRRGRILASTLRARPSEGKSLAARGVEANVLPLFDRGLVRVPIEAVFEMEKAADAYARFEAGSKLGKIVLSFD